MAKFDLSDLPPNQNDGLVSDVARSALDLAEQFGAPAEQVQQLRDLLRRIETGPRGSKLRATEIRGDCEIEVEDPLIAHGAGPAAPRRVRRGIWLKD